MKLREYNLLTAHNPKAQLFLVSFMGRSKMITFNKVFVDAMNLTQLTRIVVFNDEENPKKWFINITSDEKGYKLQHLNKSFCRIKSTQIIDELFKVFNYKPDGTYRFRIQDKIEYSGLELFPLEPVGDGSPVEYRSVSADPVQKSVVADTPHRKRGRQPGYSPKKKEAAALPKFVDDDEKKEIPYRTNDLKRCKDSDTEHDPIMESIYQKNKNCPANDKVPLRVDSKTTIWVSPDLTLAEKDRLILKRKLSTWEEKKLENAESARREFKGRNKHGFGRQYNGKAIAGIGSTDYGGN